MQYGVTEVFIKHKFYSDLRIKILKNVNGIFYLCEYLGDRLETRQEFKTNKKTYTLPENFLQCEYDDSYCFIYESGEFSIYRYKYIIHVGSSRSSKSWTIEEATVRRCEENPNHRTTIWRDTKESLAQTVWADFRKLFPISGRNYKFTQNMTPINFINGSSIQPQGDDTTNAHGLTQDDAWLNEPYRMMKTTFDQIDMRAQQIIIDMNPTGRHWSDDLHKHPRCKVINSTFQDNPFCPIEMRVKILSYDPNNQINIKNGTANKYMWQVYGLGLQAEKPNKIYYNWKIITKSEFDLLPYNSYYGLDFGSTNPSALVEVKFDGENSFFIKERLYMPISEMKTPLPQILTDLGINKKIPMICDSNDPIKISELIQNGFNAIPAIKGAGSVKAGIDFIQTKFVFYTPESSNIEYEYDNYEWEIIKNVNLDRPIKKDDHIMDAIRYVVTYLQFYLGIK